MESHGERLKIVIRALKEAGKVKSQKEFEERIEETSGGVSDIVSGRKRLNIEVLDRIKKEFPSVNTVYIITGEDAPVHSVESHAFDALTSPFKRVGKSTEERLEQIEDYLFYLITARRDTIQQISSRVEAHRNSINNLDQTVLSMGKAVDKISQDLSELVKFEPRVQVVEKELSGLKTSLDLVLDKVLNK